MKKLYPQSHTFLALVLLAVAALESAFLFIFYVDKAEAPTVKVICATFKYDPNPYQAALQSYNEGNKQLDRSNHGTKGVPCEQYL